MPHVDLTSPPQLGPVLARSLWRSEGNILLEEPQLESFPLTPVLSRAAALSAQAPYSGERSGHLMAQPFSTPSAFHHEKSAGRALLAREGRSHYGASGVGQLPLPPDMTQQELGIDIASIGGSVATVSTLALTSGIIPTAGWMTAIIPFIGPIIAGVTFGLGLLFNRKGPKQKVATTLIVDKVEPLLKQNLDGYMSGPRNTSSQRQALANFDAGWAYVVDGCGIPEMGDPGQRCVQERQAGGQWDWFARYRDPIANDTQVRADSATMTRIDPVTGQVVPVSGAGISNMMPLLLAGGLLMMWMVNR